MYEINKTGKEFYFVLKAENGEIICVSEMYKSKQKCKKGIKSVKKNADSKVIDKTK